MSGRNNFSEEIDDPIVAGALKHFKASVDAWSETAYKQPRTVVRTVRHTWRLAATWALGCLLAATSLAGGLYERHVAAGIGADRSNESGRAKSRVGPQGRRTACHGHNRNQAATNRSETRSQ